MEIFPALPVFITKPASLFQPDFQHQSNMFGKLTYIPIYFMIVTAINNNRQDFTHVLERSTKDVRVGKSTEGTL